MRKTDGKILDWLTPALLAAVVAAVFLPAIGNGFVNLDDNVNLLYNLDYRGLDWAHLRWCFTTRYMGSYQPLTWLSLAVDYVLQGMNPSGYHRTNVLLHAANAAVFYLVGLRLLAAARPAGEDASKAVLPLCAGLSSLLFALHPLRVESVAWISERRDVLSGFFYLTAVYCYLRACEAPKRGRWFFASVGSFLLALLSKAIAISLPLTLLILDVYPLNRLPADARAWFSAKNRPVLLEKAWYAVLAVPLGLATLAGALQVHRVRPFELAHLPDSSIRAAAALAFYLWKTVFPARMLPLYEWSAGLDARSLPLILSGIAIAALTAGLVAFRRRWPAGLAVWTHYVATLLPLLGFIPIPSYLVADRFTYLSCLGWPLLAGGGLLRLWRRGPAYFTLTAAVLSLAAMTVLTRRQIAVWHDSKTLWNHALSIDPRSLWARNGLGAAFAEEGNRGEAIAQYEAALAIDKFSYLSQVNVSDLYFAEGRIGAAAAGYRRVLEMNPGNASARSNLGLTLSAQGKPAEAAAQYRAALESDPGLVAAYTNLADVLLAMGEPEAAERELRKALAVDPRSFLSHNNLAVLLLNRSDREEALRHFQEALAIKPDYAEARENLRLALRRPRK